MQALCVRIQGCFTKTVLIPHLLAVPVRPPHLRYQHRYFIVPPPLTGTQQEKKRKISLLIFCTIFENIVL